MSAQIGLLVVGNEILDGIVLDTNSQWVVNQLKALNLHVKERMTVRDEVPDIARAIRRLVSDGCAIVFTLGGMGPTHDDKTLRGVTEAFDLFLELNQEALDIVTRQYREFHEKGVIETAEMTEARQKMAILPRGARPLDNRVGSAPGVVLDIEGTEVVCLPGVPKELMWMFENQVVPLLKSRVEGAYAEKIVYLSLKDESTLAPIIDEVMRDVPSVYVKSMVKPYGEAGIRLWISAMGRSQVEVDERVNRVANLLTQITEEKLQKGP
jgi:molybdenum cofactor synthesis domain-containing protein